MTRKTIFTRIRLRPSEIRVDREGGKIKYGAAHFKALAVGENPADDGKFTDVDGLLRRAELLQ